MLRSPIIVTATFGSADFSLLDGLRRRHFPPERNQVPAHLTLFHQLPPSAEAEIDRRLAEAVRTPAPKAKLAAVVDLGAGTAFRVESEGLEDLRALLADTFHGLLTPQDSGPWRPHVTIQNKVPPREAKTLQSDLRQTFEPRPLSIKGLASWRYLSGPWEPIKSYSFRG
jgi:hypothetical protein